MARTCPLSIADPPGAETVTPSLCDGSLNVKIMMEDDAMKRYALILVLLLSLLLVAPVFAAPELPKDPTNINTVLLWLMAGGAAPSIAFLFSKWKWFNALTKDAVKHALVIGAIIGIPLSAKVLIDFVPVDVWAVIQPYWSVAIGALLIGYPLSQVAFLNYIKPERAARGWEDERKISGDERIGRCAEASKPPSNAIPDVNDFREWHTLSDRPKGNG